MCVNEKIKVTEWDYDQRYQSSPLHPSGQQIHWEALRASLVHKIIKPEMRPLLRRIPEDVKLKWLERDITQGRTKPDLTQAFRAGEGQAIFSSERFPVTRVIMQTYWNLNHTMFYNVNKMTAPPSHCSIQSLFERDNKAFLWSSRGCRVH